MCYIYTTKKVRFKLDLISYLYQTIKSRAAAKLHQRTKSWRKCPPSTFVHGIAVENAKYPDDLKFLCSSENGEKLSETHAKNTFMFQPATECATHAVGITTKRGRDASKGIVQISLLCLNTTQELYSLEATRFAGGTWTEPQLCPKGKHLCGTKLEFKSEICIPKLTNTKKIIKSETNIVLNQFLQTHSW